MHGRAIASGHEPRQAVVATDADIIRRECGRVLKPKPRDGEAVAAGIDAPDH